MPLAEGFFETRGRNLRRPKDPSDVRKSTALAAFFSGFPFCRIRMGGSSKFAASFRGPAFFVDLVAPRNTQRFSGNVFGDCRACRDIRTIADFHRSDEPRVTADENAIADRGLVFVYAVIIAGDRSSTDICFRSDPGIANV